MVGKDASTLKLLEVSEGIRQKYLEQAKAASASFLLSGLNIANHCDLNYKNSKNQRLQVELSLLKICHIPSALNISASASAEALKKKPNSAVNLTPEVQKTPSESENPTALKQEEISVPAQKELEKTAAESLPAPQVTAPPLPIEKPKISIQSFKAIPSIIPNLNDLSSPISKDEDDAPKYVSGESRTPFTADNLLKIWNGYAADIKKAGKINLFTIMTANPPSLLDDFKIELTIENRIQEELLMVEKIDLLNFLRLTLENYGVEIITRQAEQNEKKKLYTSHEKYQHMVAKNPTLEEFRRKFNLDVN